MSFKEPETKGDERRAWWERMLQLYPALAPKPLKRPATKGDVDPLLWEDAPYALHANIKEAAQLQSFWERHAAAAPQGPDRESKWEREMLWCQVTRYRCEQAHWREMLGRFEAELRARPDLALKPVAPRNYRKAMPGER